LVAAPRSVHLPAAVVTDLAAVRELVRERAAAAGFAPVEVDDLVQAVDESATNVLVHGYRKQPGLLTVSVATATDEAGTPTLTVRIEDDAPAFDPRGWERPDADAPWPRRRPGGFGIPLTRGCVDEIYHRERDGGHGNVLTLVKRGSGRERESA